MRSWIERGSRDGSRPAPLPAADRALIVLNAAAGVSALAGMWYALGGAPNVPREWLNGSPFNDYRVPGLILGGVYAPASLAAAAAVRRRHRLASEFALGSGAVQVSWIGAQVAIIGRRSFLQPLMGTVGLVDLGLAWQRLSRRRT